MRQKPSLPWKQPRNMKLVNKFHEEAVIHVFQVLNTKPTVFPPLARSVPSNKAARAMAFVLPGPKKSAALGVNQITHTFRQQNRRHVVDGQTS